MGSTLSLVLLGAGILVGLCAIGAWLAIGRPAQVLLRRQRAEALAAAQRYTPASRVSPYGASATDAADAAGPGRGDRVETMRTLLQRGDRGAERVSSALPNVVPAREDMDSTSPMAWNPTLPPDDAEEWHFRRRDRTGAPNTGHGHITLF